ncbi:MAG: hypothetical protein FD145_906 [Candidatus Saganbacteria bacterium]|uniref:Terminase large subunit gp17-like C-terminal domain-containing protein n=1 Tax=Candidatus Saganbacteria bacterium TaxID=2575572 RepID=A0A833NWY0_UNCSA|nr:MAG: hypothetical protein FD145_906 [Candidatus Saganbacteria bacterium]
MVKITIPYSPHHYQALFHGCPVRHRALIAGVRGGKTVAGANEAIRLSLSKPRQFGWIIAPTYPMLTVARDELFKWLPKEVVKSHNKTEKRLTLINGTTIEFKSADDPDSLRGRGLNFAWIDEGAYISENAWRVIYTRLADRQGRAFITTTPKGKNWIFDFFKKAEKFPDEYAAIFFKSVDNPYFPPEEIDKAKAELPSLYFNQEYCADFIDELGWFRYEWLAQCFDESLCLQDRDTRGLKTFQGVDLALSADGDYFVIVTLGIDEGENRIILDIFRKKGLSPKALREAIIERAKAFKPRLIFVENNAFQDSIRQDLVEMTSLPIKGFTTGKQKADPTFGVPSLSILFENKKIKIPRGDKRSIELTDVLVDELLRYPSAHTGDVLMALWFANEAVRGKGRSLFLWVEPEPVQTIEMPPASQPAKTIKQLHEEERIGLKSGKLRQSDLISGFPDRILYGFY